MTRALETGNSDPQGQEMASADRQQEWRRLTKFAADPTAQKQDDDDIVNLRHYWSILLRRKWTLFISLAIALVAALVHTYNTTPLYRTSVSLQVQQPTIQLTGLQSESSFGLSYSNAMRYQKTQEDVLRSHTLARRVIDQLGLEALQQQQTGQAASFLKKVRNTFNRWIRGTDESETENGPAVGRARRKTADLENMILNAISVQSDPKSQVMRISYVGPVPTQAAAIANAMAKNFVAMNLERRYEATSYAEGFLQERLEQVRAQLEDSEQRLVAYARDREIINPDDKLATLMATLKELSYQMVQVEAERIEAESVYSQFLKGAGPGVLQIMESPVIQSLKEQKTTLELEYQSLPKIYKADYPAKQQLQRQIDEIDQKLKAEIDALNDQIKAAYDAKVQQQAGMQARIDEVKNQILALRDRTTDYQVMKREADTNRDLYNNLLQRMKEIGVVSGIANNNITVIDLAPVPKVPFKPDLAENLKVSLFIGLVGGIGLAFLFEHLDDTIKTSEEVENRVGAPVLGVIPFVGSKTSSKAATDSKQHISLIAARNPRSPLAEAARSLTTALSFSSAGGTPKVMHVTSSSAGEGKTTVATNIAIAFAHAGHKVLQIDADLRSPSLHHLFDLPNASGLSNYLAGNVKPADIARPTSVPGLFAITSGPLPPNPMELLVSARMLDLISLTAERFDFVLIDGPPVIGLADSIVLSQLARNTVFVAAVGSTRYGNLDGAVKRLLTTNANIVGSVVNRFDQARGRYGYGYGYNYDYHYSYEYGAKDQTTGLPEKA